MRANELMVGDWVLNSKGQKCKVHEVSNIFESKIMLDNYDKENDGCFEMEFEVSPIRLSEDMIRVLFPHSHTSYNDYHKVDEERQIYIGEGSLVIIARNIAGDYEFYVITAIQYVHELQHILKDLKIKKDINL